MNTPTNLSDSISGLDSYLRRGFRNEWDADLVLLRGVEGTRLLDWMVREPEFKTTWPERAGSTIYSEKKVDGYLGDFKAQWESSQ
jgi:hypothetical protein